MEDQQPVYTPALPHWENSGLAFLFAFWGHGFAVSPAFALAFAIVLAFGAPASAFAFAGVLAFTSMLVFLALAGLLTGVRCCGLLVARAGLRHRRGACAGNEACQSRPYQQCSHGFRHCSLLLLTLFSTLGAGFLDCAAAEFNALTRSLRGVMVRKVDNQSYSTACVADQQLEPLTGQTDAHIVVHWRRKC